MSERCEVLDLYKRYRAIGRELNRLLLKRVPKRTLVQSAKKLGFRKRGILVFDSEDETSVLMDYCIHSYRGMGPTVVERFLAEAPYPPDSDEMTLLKAKAKARYALFTVQDAEPGFGVHGKDTLRNESLFLIDVGFSQTATPGTVLATRIVRLPRFAMTAGAALPVASRILREIGKALFIRFGKKRAFDPRDLTPKDESAFAAICIRCCHKAGAARYMTYEDVP